MQDDLLVRIEEGTETITIDIYQEPAAFPEPSSFIWSKDGAPLTSLIQTYSSVTFTTFGRNDTGNYTVSATNFLLDNLTNQVGNDTGSFLLDVICKFIDNHISILLLQYIALK